MCAFPFLKNILQKNPQKIPPNILDFIFCFFIDLGIRNTYFTVLFTTKMRIITQLILGFSVGTVAVWRIPHENEAQYAKRTNYLSKERNVDILGSSPKFCNFLNNLKFKDSADQECMAHVKRV